MNWNTLKRAFLASLAILVINAVIRSIVLSRGVYSPAYLDFQTLTIGLEGFAFISGAILLGRWIRRKGQQMSANRAERLLRRNSTPMDHRTSQNNNEQGNKVAARWNALMKYDNEIRAAAEQLRPFGESWVDELGKDFFALNEDKHYLPIIVSRLSGEAEKEKAQGWTKVFRQTADGEPITEESLSILQNAKSRGYAVDVESDKTIIVSKVGHIFYLRSNLEILQFGNSTICG